MSVRSPDSLKEPTEFVSRQKSWISSWWSRKREKKESNDLKRKCGPGSGVAILAAGSIQKTPGEEKQSESPFALSQET